MRKIAKQNLLVTFLESHVDAEWEIKCEKITVYASGYKDAKLIRIKILSIK